MESVRRRRIRNGARSNKLVKQTAGSGRVFHASIHILSKAPSVPQPPQLPSTHNGSIESLHLSSTTCPEPNPLSFFSLVLFFYFFTPPHCLTVSPSRVNYHACGDGGAQLLCWWGSVQTSQGRSEWTGPVGRHKRWTNGRDHILINAEHTASFSDLTLNQVLSFSHSQSSWKWYQLSLL